MVLKDEKVLQVLDKIGFFISLVTLCILMLVLVQANIYFLIIFGILFIYTVFQMIEFLENLGRLSKKKRIIKYSFRTIRN